MLQDCIDIFKKNPDIDKLILDTYVPADGTYLIMEESGEGFYQKELLEIKLDKKTKKLNITDDEKQRISYIDYYCRLLDMNKPIDPKKIIHSNNYLSFWIKKDNVNREKLPDDIIDNYYDILENPYKKYKGAKDKELYSSVENEIGEVNIEKIQKIRKWIKSNIFNLPFELSGKDYLKIFFICDGTDFKKESSRYILPNIYNKNDYNIKIGENIMGLPNENMGLNSKKPYLENKTRKITVPVLTDTKEILIRKKFFDYLWNQASLGNLNIYLDMKTNRITPYDYKTSPTSEFNGFFLRIKKGKNEAAILDMDIITSYKPELKKPLFIENVIGMDDEKLIGHAYGRVTKLYDIRDLINKELFSNLLIPNLFTEPQEVDIDDSTLKECILVARTPLFNWFYKGYDTEIINVLDNISLQLIKNSISNNYSEKVQHQFNIRISLIEYFKGGKIKMADVMKEIRNTLREKINTMEYESISTDEEYYYAVGQMLRFFISLNKSSKKVHSLFNPFLNIKSDKMLKEKMAQLFKKYNYAIEERRFRFNNLYKLIISYKPETEINQDYMIAGYISNNLLYEKREDK